MNPSKTEGQLFVSGYNCDPQTAYFDFELTNTMARTIKGDYSKGGCNIAHHIVQSFAPYDKITPEQAHAIGKEFAKCTRSDAANNKNKLVGRINFVKNKLISGE